MSYEIVFYDPHMKEITRATLDDPKPTGRQLLAQAGYRDPREHRVMVLQSDQQLEDIDLEETVNLSKSGKTRFILFANSDQSFNFILDTQRQPWGAKDISEPMLRALAGVTDDFRVWQEGRAPAEEDVLLGRGQIVTLGGEGVERFFTGKEDTSAG